MLEAAGHVAVGRQRLAAAGSGDAAFGMEACFVDSEVLGARPIGQRTARRLPGLRSRGQRDEVKRRRQGQLPSTHRSISVRVNLDRTVPGN
jgi:hypothetical protein